MVEERHGRVDLDVPVPSRSSDRSMVDSLVSRLRLAVRGLLMRRSYRGAARPERGERLEERGRLVGRARRDAQRARQSDVADQDVALEQRAERRLRVGDTVEQHEVRVAVERPVPEHGQLEEQAVALGGDVVDHREHLGRVGERGDRRRLRQRRQVIRQAHETQGVGDGRVGGEVADAGAREGERLAHRARDDQAFATGQEGQRARRAGRHELGVRLVDEQDAVVRLVGGLDRVEGDRRARRVVRGAEEDEIGLLALDRRDDGLGAERVVRVALGRQPAGAGAGGDDRVHRVGRREAQHAAPGAAERLQQLLDDLVRPVRRPDLLPRSGRARGSPRGTRAAP